MKRLTISVPEDQYDLLEEKSGEDGQYESKSDVVRAFITDREVLHNRIEELEAKLEKRESTVDELQAQLDETQYRIEEYSELDEYVEKLETKLDEQERTIDNLRNQLAATNARQDDVSELVEYVETERELQRRREERRDAPIWRRAKWYVFGRNRAKSE